MAKFKITNFIKITPILKSFKCHIGAVCSIVRTRNDYLYHNGSGTYPTSGDTIYFKNDQNEYEIASNYSFSYKSNDSIEIYPTYFSTDVEGILVNTIVCSSNFITNF